jgi:uncharacterized protein
MSQRLPAFASERLSWLMGWDCSTRCSLKRSPTYQTHGCGVLQFADAGRGSPDSPPASFFGPWWGNMRPMNQATLIEVLRNYDAALRETGATGLFVFGSRAVGTQRPDSNLDLFIDYDAATKIPNMFCLMQIEDEISEALGIPVTITTRNALHPLMKESIEQDAIRVS